MKKYLHLIRVRQYIKNILIFVPAFFAGTFIEKENLYHLSGGFTAFCAVCSMVYIINDIRDVEKDRRHPVKSKRPIAAGMITIDRAKWLAVIMGISGWCLLSITLKKMFTWAHIYLLIYVTVNIGYSFGLKNIPILDIMILASGFLIRILYGAALCDTWVSNWLYLTVLMISLYLGTGKRKNERMKEQNHQTRSVLKYYSLEYLEKIMQMCMILAVTFYSLWSASIAERAMNTPFMIWTIPLVLTIIMRYEMIVERDNYGDPTELIITDRVLCVLSVIYGGIVFVVLYGKNIF